MKILHLSDLHLGKRLNEYPLIEDQRHILGCILAIAKAQRPDAVLICGDLYDKTMPSVEAVELLDDFLVNLHALVPHIFLISGNHDSAERIAFGGRLMAAEGIHIAPVYDGTLSSVWVTGSDGTQADVFMLPFIKPAHVRRFFPDTPIDSYTEAAAAALSRARLSPDRPAVLLTHQFVTGGERSDSEELTVGGTDNVDASVFNGFAYVALGHLHRAQNIGPGCRIRYCGTPLKYSFSEASDEKSVSLVTLEADASVRVDTVPLVPLHDVRTLRGPYLTLTSLSFYRTMNTEDYLHITLTDEEDVPDALYRLRVIYPNLMKLTYDNTRTRAAAQDVPLPDPGTRSVYSLFDAFYTAQNGRSMSEEQQTYMRALIDTIWEERT